jgi:hypothetical protein
MPEFSFNIVAGSRCGKATTAHQFVLANATPDVSRSISRSLARLAVSTLWHFRGSATGALWRRIGIIINRKSPRSRKRARGSVVALRTPVLCSLHGGGHEKG